MAQEYKRKIKESGGREEGTEKNIVRKSDEGTG
jgi:hypothetical protein